MSDLLKYILIVFIVIFQLGGLVLLFFNKAWAIIAFFTYGVLLLILLVVFIVERRKEKKEEIDYDDCDY
ncbi:hypothetical protein [Alkalihalobacillus deserti]|uniref:hypothetical protein n=1 Tax=Alkalihalobacillus deserti TaxID=2879466 RepID=UPI001D1469A0|nr:hypothetical protein [Alkalihalobacillus deserti]